MPKISYCGVTRPKKSNDSGVSGRSACPKFLSGALRARQSQMANDSGVGGRSRCRKFLLGCCVYIVLKRQMTVEYAADQGVQNYIDIVWPMGFNEENA